MKQYAYMAGYTTKEQNIDRQILALKPYQISKKNIYCDYQSGKDFLNSTGLSEIDEKIKEEGGFVNYKKY